MLLQGHGRRGWVEDLLLTRIRTRSGRYKLRPSCLERYTWRYSTLNLYTNLSLLRNPSWPVHTSGLLCRTSRPMVEWYGATVVSLERRGFKSITLQQTWTQAMFLSVSPFLLGASSNRCITVSRTSLVSACTSLTAPMFYNYCHGFPSVCLHGTHII